MGDSATQTEGDVSVGDTVIYTPGKVVTEYEECHGQVRWREGVLEQLWTVTGIGTTGAIETVDHVWRPVPKDAPDA